jgi:hypothetical protein
MISEKWLEEWIKYRAWSNGTGYTEWPGPLLIANKPVMIKNIDFT